MSSIDNVDARGGKKYIKKSFEYIDLVFNRLGFIVVAVILGFAFGLLISPVMDYLTARMPDASRETRYISLMTACCGIGLSVWFVGGKPIRFLRTCPAYARFALFSEGKDLLGETSRLLAAIMAAFTFGTSRVKFEILNAIGLDIPPVEGWMYVCIGMAVILALWSWRLLLPRTECS